MMGELGIIYVFAFLVICIPVGLSVYSLLRAYTKRRASLGVVDAERSEHPILFWIFVASHVFVLILGTFMIFVLMVALK